VPLIAALLAINYSRIDAYAGTDHAASAVVTAPAPPKPFSSSAQWQTTPPERAIPELRVLGVPLRVWSPVDPPYQPSAYSDLGGQPETGRDAILAEGMASE
jgi:hypothetical protein